LLLKTDSEIGGLSEIGSIVVGAIKSGHSKLIAADKLNKIKIFFS
jgi:hypothetical protein